MKAVKKEQDEERRYEKKTDWNNETKGRIQDRTGVDKKKNNDSLNK